MLRQSGVAYESTDLEAAVRCRFYGVERKGVDIDEKRWCLYTELHQVDECGAACDEAKGAGWRRCDRCCLGECGGTAEVKVVHFEYL